jgi:hypothetical protein
MQIPLVLGSQLRNIYELDKKTQRSKSLQRLDFGQNFHRSAEQFKTYQKHVESYTPPQQNFTKLFRMPAGSIPKGRDRHAFYMMIAC